LRRHSERSEESLFGFTQVVGFCPDKNRLPRSTFRDYSSFYTTS